MSKFVVIYLCILLKTTNGIFTKFKNYTIYEVTAFNARERALLYYLYVRNEMMVFMNGITNEAAVPMDVIVDECCTRNFEEKLIDNDIEYIKIGRHQLVRKLEDVEIKLASYPYVRLPNLTTAFHSWDTLMAWIEIKLKKSTMLRKIRIAKTHEKRDVIALKISTGRKNSAVFLLGGEDGKDWLSPAILMNFIDYILEQKLNVDLLVKHHDFYILPILNPDGYEYSLSKDWSWARNRKHYFSKKVCPRNLSAIGINLDRNWYFGKNLIRDEECDPVFSGSKPLSEEETAGLSKFLDSIALHMMVFINVRGFERLVTVPYGYNTEYCNNYPVLMDILSSVYDRVKESHQATFLYGTTATYYYNFSGNVADWVKRKLNTPVVYTFFMKLEGYIFPRATDVTALTDQFSTMMKEILMLSGSIYSPLFNHQYRPSVQIITIIINFVINFII